jgi:glycosyltransferase involved in cell wall biosynthesis
LNNRAAFSSVAHVIGYYPPHLGGMEKVAEELATRQKRNNYNVTVITSNVGYEGTHISETKDEPRVIRLKTINIVHTPIMPKLLYQLLQLNRKTLVHVHIAQAFVPEMVYVAAKIRRSPYVAHLHVDVTPSGPAGVLLRVYKPIVLKRVLRRAVYVVVFNEAQKDVISKKYNIAAEKIKVIPNGVSEDYFDNRKKQLHKKPRLLFLGRLDVQKNPEQLLRALKGISSKFKTTFVGSGELEPKLKELTSTLKLKNIEFYGRAEKNETIELYQESDIFVMTSVTEGMPLALLEAMAMGLPVVANDVVGIRGLVEENKNAYLVPLNDIEATQIALLKITSDEDTYMNMSNVSKKIASRYSWHKVCEEFDDLYKEIHANI